MGVNVVVKVKVVLMLVSFNISAVEVCELSGRTLPVVEVKFAKLGVVDVTLACCKHAGS